MTHRLYYTPDRTKQRFWGIHCEEENKKYAASTIIILAPGVTEQLGPTKGIPKYVIRFDNSRIEISGDTITVLPDNIETKNQ